MIDRRGARRFGVSGGPRAGARADPGRRPRRAAALPQLRRHRRLPRRRGRPRCWTRCVTQWDDMVARKIVRHRRRRVGRPRRRRSASRSTSRPTPPTPRPARRSRAVMWSWRMLQATGEVRFADELERALYNAVLVGVARRRSRCTPTRTRSQADERERRHPWYECACCPPNVMRTARERCTRYLVTRRDGAQSTSTRPASTTACGSAPTIRGTGGVEIEADDVRAAGPRRGASARAERRARGARLGRGRGRAASSTCRGG